MATVTHFDAYGLLGRCRHKAISTHTRGLDIVPNWMNLCFHRSNFNLLSLYGINAGAFLASDCKFVFQSPFH